MTVNTISEGWRLRSLLQRVVAVAIFVTLPFATVRAQSTDLTDLLNAPSLGIFR